MKDFTDTQIDEAMANLGNYRVKRVQSAANEGPLSSEISGALLLSLGLRDTSLANIEGGVKQDAVTGKWIKQDSHMLMHVGVFQISRRHNALGLRRMLAVENDTWGPVVVDKTPVDLDFVPRFEEALQFTLTELREAMGLLDDMVEPKDLLRTAIAAHNAGIEKAKQGYREGNIDRYTTMRDYSAWVLRHRIIVNRWLGRHPDWQIPVA